MTSRFVRKETGISAVVSVDAVVQGGYSIGHGVVLDLVVFSGKFLGWLAGWSIEEPAALKKKEDMGCLWTWSKKK